MRVIAIMVLLSMAYAYKDIDDSYNFYSDLHHKDKLKAMVDCFLDRVACSDTMKHIKAHWQQLMMDGCAECDTIQKHYTHEFLDAVRSWYPDDLASIDSKYDSDGKHLQLLQKSVEDN